MTPVTKVHSTHCYFFLERLPDLPLPLALELLDVSIPGDPRLDSYTAKVSLPYWCPLQQLAHLI